MFKFLYRKTSLRGYCEDDVKKAMLLKDEFKINLILSIIFAFIIAEVIPLLIINRLHIFLLSNKTILCISSVIYGIIAIIICKKFMLEIMMFKHWILAKIYTALYTFKGDALSKKDLYTIKANNKDLYWCLNKMQGCRGFCYAISFEMLKALKKGTIKFFALEKFQLENCIKEQYTTHVVYENNGWCFDTYSHKQYPLDEFIGIWKGKEYKTFTYEDIKGKTYKQFREKELPEFEKFCKQNDCYTEWGKPKM